MKSCYAVTVFNNGRYLTHMIAINSSAVDALRDAFADETWIAIAAHPVYTNDRVHENAYDWRSLIKIVGTEEWGDEYNEEEY